MHILDKIDRSYRIGTYWSPLLCYIDLHHLCYMWTLVSTTYICIPKFRYSLPLPLCLRIVPPRILVFNIWKLKVIKALFSDCVTSKFQILRFALFHYSTFWKAFLNFESSECLKLHLDCSASELQFLCICCSEYHAWSLIIINHWKRFVKHLFNYGKTVLVLLYIDNCSTECILSKVTGLWCAAIWREYKYFCGKCCIDSTFWLRQVLHLWSWGREHLESLLDMLSFLNWRQGKVADLIQKLVQVPRLFVTLDHCNSQVNQHQNLHSSRLVCIFMYLIDLLFWSSLLNSIDINM